MSLIEGYSGYKNSKFYNVYLEIRKLFRNYLINKIINLNIEPNLLKSLFYMHKIYGKFMGNNGEKMRAVLTINYDYLIENAISTIYNGINIGYSFSSKDYSFNNNTPPLFKLHGSFNWKIKNNNLSISNKYCDNSYNDYSGWMPPSVYKKPPKKVYREIWDKARIKLKNCDILRVVGSSLRSEDWAIISLLFTGQLLSDVPFTIELIVPDKIAIGDDTNKGIMERLSFLSDVKNFSQLPIFERGEIISNNIFHQWVQKKLQEIELKTDKVTEDSYINEWLMEGS